MAEWLRARSCPPDNHLPPADASPFLTVNSKGKTVPTEQFTIDLDEFGVPIPKKVVELVSTSVNPNYEWPRYTNVHHTAWPRRHYDTKIERAYRGSPTLMVHMPVQAHNLLHALTVPSPKPDLEVMHGRVQEERRVQNLFEIGRRAVRFMRLGDTLPFVANSIADDAWLLRTMEYYDRRGCIDEAAFFRYLERVPEGEFGILPTKELLVSQSLEKSVKTLGKIAAAEAIDLRRATQRLTAA